MSQFSKELLLLLAASLVLTLSGCGSQLSDSSQAAVQAGEPVLQASWQKVVPGGDTQCSDGSEFAFYTRAGDPTKLLFYLEGGGACWNLQTCDPLGTPSYTVNLEGFHPSQADGLFNFSHAANPVRDHTIVFVPYCSADVHMGAAIQTYDRPAGWIETLQQKGVLTGPITSQFSVAHRGFANARAALTWLKNGAQNPRSIIVAGSSAGSIPSPYYAHQLAAQYPGARVSQLGDGSGGYRQMNQSASPHLAWNTVGELSADPAFAALDNTSFNFEALYVLAQAAQPRLRLHAYDTAEDAVQLQFLQMAGLRVASLREAITLNQADIRRGAPTFASYIAGGALHTILRRPEFYQFAVGDRSVRDWVAAIVVGQDVESVVYSANP